MKLNRRRFLQAATLGSVAGPQRDGQVAHSAPTLIHNISRLNPVSVADEITPRSTKDVGQALHNWHGRVCIGGGRYSMGGQIAASNSLHLDMRAMSRVVFFQPKLRIIRVQAGMTWRDIQDVIDPHDLSIKIMQSYSNFTVGGSVSVNCHGRYVGQGPVAHSVRALQMVMANGDVLELSREHHTDLFRAVFGSYGGLGVLTEVELDLDVNTRIEKVVQDIPLEAYPDFFLTQVQTDPHVVFHNADLRFATFKTPRTVSWRATDQALTEPQRLVPRHLDYSLEKNSIWAITELPGGHHLREQVIEPLIVKKNAVVWRNHEASLDAASLEPRTRAISTYLLQEYFIPVAKFLLFVHRMMDILKQHQVQVLNISIRHSPPDRVALLKWAPVEVFSFVLYYKQRSHDRASQESGAWTRLLIDAALMCGGRYYLPYRLDATQAQFEQAYPEVRTFAALKKQFDPTGRFSNQLWERYLPAV